MSSISFRDSVVVIVDTSRTLIRAGLGLHDLLRTPAVVCLLRRQLNLCSGLLADRVLSQELPARVGLRRTTTNGENTNGDAPTEPSASTSKLTGPSAKVTEYLVGAQLDEALASGQDIDVFWPFADGDVSDWTQAEALWYVHPLPFTANAS